MWLAIPLRSQARLYGASFAIGHTTTEFTGTCSNLYDPLTMLQGSTCKLYTQQNCLELSQSCLGEGSKWKALVVLYLLDDLPVPMAQAWAIYHGLLAHTSRPPLKRRLLGRVEPISPTEIFENLTLASPYFDLTFFGEPSP